MSLRDVMMQMHSPLLACGLAPEHNGMPTQIPISLASHCMNDFAVVYSHEHRGSHLLFAFIGSALTAAVATKVPPAAALSPLSAPPELEDAVDAQREKVRMVSRCLHP